MSSKNYLETILWDSTHYCHTDKHKNGCYELMSNQTTEEFNKAIKQISLTTIKSVVEYNKSIYEYCSKYGGILADLNHMAQIIKDDNPELYKQYKKLCKDPSEEFNTYIKWVVMDIKVKGNDFDIFDYYYFTKLHPLTFRSICEKIISAQNFKIVVSVLNKFYSYDYMTIDKEQELSGTIIIKGHEFSREEKEKIFDYLDENNMPHIVFKAALRKYIDGDERITEYINNKQKIKNEG